MSLQRDQGDGFAHFCGGSVIEDNIVLTAAHCLKDKQASEVKAVFGTEDLSLSGHHRTERNVSKIIIHPLYNAGESYFDVPCLSLIKNLCLVMEFLLYVCPLKLHQMKHYDLISLPCLLVGDPPLNQVDQGVIHFNMQI